MRQQPPPLPSAREQDTDALAHVTVVTLTRQRKSSSVVRKITHAIVVPDDPMEVLPVEAGGSARKQNEDVEGHDTP